MKRVYQRLIVVIVSIAIIIVANIATKWISIGDRQISKIEEIKGDYLSYEEAKKAPGSFDIEKEYYRKYYVNTVFKRGTFPFLETTVDTIKNEIWQHERRN